MVSNGLSLNNIFEILHMMSALDYFALPIAQVNIGVSFASYLGLLQALGALGDFALPIAQVNYGVNFAGYLGILQALGALGYFALSIAQRSHRIFAPFLLLLSGGILYLNGWRLDPLLQLQQLSISVLIGYLIFLDLKNSTQSTQQ